MGELLGHGLGGDEVEDALAFAAVEEGEDLADEGLAGGGDGRDEEVAAVEDLAFFEGPLLEGEEPLTVFPLEDRDDVRIEPEGLQEVNAHGMVPSSTWMKRTASAPSCRWFI
jgi:hypothetical protein